LFKQEGGNRLSTINAESTHNGMVDNAGNLSVSGQIVTDNNNLYTGQLIAQEDSGTIIGVYNPHDQQYGDTHYVDDNQSWNIDKDTGGDTFTTEEITIQHDTIFLDTSYPNIELEINTKEENNINMETVYNYDVYILAYDGGGVDELKEVEVIRDVYARNKEEASFEAKVHKIMEENNLKPAISVVKYKKNFSLKLELDN
jgi:hypothetical protein